MPYEIREHEGKHCLYKKDTGKIVMGSCHAERAETEKMMRAIMANEQMRSTTFILDNFVATKPGEPYRLLPFGQIRKGGRVRDITPELAEKFKLPPFKPPIKLGSHEEATPAGGHMLRLEVRQDGLWVYPELTDKGSKAATDGDYRYHSPEIIWEDGALETAEGIITGPLVVGDAWLHSPFFGENASFYTTESISVEETQMNENVTIPQGLWDKFIAPLFAKEPEKVEVVKTVEPEDYAATKQERDQYKAQIEQQKAEAERKARVDKFDAELKETKADPTMAELLADLPEDKAGAIMQEFKKLSAQVNDEKLNEELGDEGKTTAADPKAQFNALVLQAMKDKSITNYNAAFEVVKLENADLFKQAFPK